MNERRGAWYLLTGLVLGLVIGLVYSLLIDPVEFARTAPQSLGADYKDTYRVLIAKAFEANGDIGRAQARLSLLQDENMVGVLAEQAQRLIAQGGRPEEARALDALSDTLLDQALATATPALITQAPETASDPSLATATQQISTSTVDPERAILTPTALPSEQPTLFPSLTPRTTALPDTVINALFTLEEQLEVCDPQAGARLQIEVLDKNGNPLAGIPILVRWASGEDRFYTGLHPQISAGYADFSMLPDETYSVQAGLRGMAANGFTTIECTGTDGQNYTGGWQLTFVEP